MRNFIFGVIAGILFSVCFCEEYMAWSVDVCATLPADTERAIKVINRLEELEKHRP